MEAVGGSVEKRGRKRKDVQSSVCGAKAKKRVVTRGGKMILVGRYVKKDFNRTGGFLGKVVFYKDGLYMVEYEDGDCEDLDSAEVKEFLVDDSDMDKGLKARKTKLEKLIAKKNAKHAQNSMIDVRPVKECVLTDIGADDDGDLSSDLSDHDQTAEANLPIIPPPELPPSSGNIGVSEEHVSYLLSVYGFLRSFSIQLFLSPFGLDDFVGSLNCCLPNTLLDAVHVALMRVLKRHLEMLSSDGSELASKCMRLADWSLLDTLTWPICLLQYLMIMGHVNGTQWKGFYVDALEKNYYSLPTGWKLMILQMLCDDVLESVELRSEIDTREEAEFGTDPDAVAASASESGPWRVHPKYSKTTACKNDETVGVTTGTHGINSNENANTVDDGNGDECRLCGMDGTLLCCDGCPSAYHSRCIGISKMFIPEGTWYCPECAISRAGLTIAKGTLLTGAQFFGVDLHGHIFLGTCNHLLVLDAAIKSEPCFRYYHQNDIPNVLQALMSSAQHVISYSDICKGIVKYWDIQKDVIIPFLAKVEMDEQLAKVEDSSQCLPINMLGGESHILLDLVEDKKPESLKTESGTENVVDLYSEKTTHDSLLNRSLPNTNGSYLGILDVFFENKDDIKRVAGAGNRKSSSDFFYKGLNFKSQAYINNYIQGDFAASAAANLAVLSSEEKEISESHSLDKRRRMALAENLLQVKAFSAVAVRFFWPTTEKKLVEVPRERCGWCLSCKSTAVSKKACLLNGAASNAIKGAMKILSGLPTLRIGEGNFRAIATYIIFLEESLRGLVVGSFRSVSYRKQWRTRVEKATNCGAIKSVLLELEKNICVVALSPDWFKLVDSWLVESSVPQSAIIAIGSVQKRCLSGRRGRKPSVVSVTASDDQAGSSVDFTWWRGGIISKRILQRGVLPCLMLKKAAQQGGSRRIPEIAYAEGIEIPVRSRQYFWRAAVDMSKNASELALQVRRLDLYVRWSDLVRPDQTLQDGKGLDLEASAFRNAFVSDKKIVEDKITYGVSFRSQKHLPSRVMKNIIEVEQTQDGKEKYWFSETRIPLYLIKDYEEKVDEMPFSLPHKPADLYSNLQRRQLKACRKDIFSYLSCKRDNEVKCSCASCQLDVLLRDTVKCNVCEGFCHEQCTIGSAKHMDGKVEYLKTCKLCRTKSLPQSENKSPTSPLLLQGKDVQNAVSAHKGVKLTIIHKPLTPVRRVNTPLVIKSAPRDSGSTSIERRNIVRNYGSVSTEKRKLPFWGLIFKKNYGKTEEEKKDDEDGLRFRIRHIVGKRRRDIIAGIQCHLCDQPYNPDLLYILCDTCTHWFHTDALELDESRISDLVGFKCCNCRRIRSPVCPYSDPSKRKITIESKKLCTRGAYGSETESSSFYQPMEEGSCISGDDSLLYSHSIVGQYSEPNSETDTQWNSASRSGPQKLPVRRLGNSDKNTTSFTSTEQGSFQDQAQVYSPSPCLDWDVSANGFDGGISFDCNDLNFEDMEFEPQTYFSFNELLGPEDGVQGNEANAGTIGCGDAYVDEFGNSCGDLGNGYMDDFVIVDDDTTAQEPLPIPETSSNVIFCQGCSLADAGPYLCCEICKICYHRHCSPWVEKHPQQGQWRCGKCREWR